MYVPVYDSIVLPKGRPIASQGAASPPPVTEREIERGRGNKDEVRRDKYEGRGSSVTTTCDREGGDGGARMR